MREIKFRYFEDRTDYGEPGYICATLDDIYEDIDSYYSGMKFRGQYIGLKDKNGTEIYEGDIVKMSSEPDNELHLFEVIWCDRELMWDVKNIDLPDNICYVINENYNVEVIGNIYENPGLLDGN